MTKPPPNIPSEAQALSQLKTHLDSISFFQDASVARLPELDVGDYFAFSVMPKATGRAGEVTYLVGAQEIVSSGQQKSLNKIMKTLATTGAMLDMHFFARLFLRMEALRYGVILEQPDGHVLMKPNQLPTEQFEPPSSNKKADGFHYQFWFFDTDRYLPVHYKIRVKNDGEVTYTFRELKH